MRKILLQRLLLVVGVIALAALLIELGISIAATTHSSTAARVVHVQAGPYPLTVSLYKDPANAGYALPFAISSTKPLFYDVTTNPHTKVTATAIHASINPDVNNKNEVQGTAEITVRGDWLLHIVASGPQGKGMADVPIVATAPPPIPQWLGWLIGGIVPLGSLFLFLFLQRAGKLPMAASQKEQVPATF